LQFNDNIDEMTSQIQVTNLNYYIYLSLVINSIFLYGF